MANQKTTSLTAKTTASSTDVMYLVDLDSTATSKKITVDNLMDYYDTTTATMTNKTLTSPVINTGVTGTAVLDDDTMATATATALATSESIKAYVDSTVTAQDLDTAGDTGTGAIDLDSQSLTLTGGTGITTTAANQAVTFDIDSTVTTLTGTQTLTNKTLTSVVSINELKLSANATDFNTFVGITAGDNFVAGARENTFLGDGAGEGGAVTSTADDNTGVGYNSLTSLTTGSYNSAFGNSSMISNTTGGSNAAYGGYSLLTNSTGSNNTGIGYSALFYNSTGSGNVALGRGAGNRETGSNAFYVNNQSRSNTAGDKAKSILYGVMAAAAADQKLTINALLNLSVSKTPASAAAAGVAGDIAWDASYIYVCTATDAWERVAIASW